MKRLQTIPWPTWVAIGPGHASASAQPVPNSTLPAMWRRWTGVERQSMRSPVSSARRPPQQPDADGGDEHRRGEEQEQVGLLEQQRAADHVGVAHPGPRQRDPEHEADEQAGEPHVSASITNETTIAVPKNVAVAASAARESIDVPVSPLPDVQPPAVFAPKPISTPASEQDQRDEIHASPSNVRVSQP